MDRNPKILYCCNAAVDVALVRIAMQRAGMPAEMQCIDSEAAYALALSLADPQAIIYNHPASGLSLNKVLDALRNKNLTIPVILIAQPADEDFALGMLASGVADYVLADRMRRLPAALTNAIAKAGVEAQNATQRATITLQTQTMNMAAQAAKIGNIRIDMVTGARDWSCGADQIFGFEPGSVHPSFDLFYKLVHPEDKERVQREIEYGFGLRDSFLLDFRIITPAGQLKYINSTLVVSRDEEGNPQTARCFIQDVTERKESEFKLKNAWHDLNLLFGTLDDVFFSRDMVTSKLLQVSPACEKLYGYTAEEFLADPDLNEWVIHPDFKDVRIGMMQELLKGHVSTAQYKVVHKNGSIKWVENKLVPSFDNEGLLIRIDGVTRDITEQKNAEQGLRNNEQYYKSLFENIDDVVTVIDANRKLLHASANVVNTLGYSFPEYEKARNEVDFVHPDHKLAKQLVFEQVLQNPGKKIAYSFQVRHKSGNWIWVEGTVQNLLEDESVRGIVNTYRDVTEKKMAEKQLQDNEQRFRSLFENIADVVTVVDADREFIYANENLTKIFGYTLEEYKKARYREDFIHPDYKPEEQLLFANVIQNPGQTFSFDLQFKHKKGHWVWLEGTVKNLLHLESVKGIVSNYRDVTEQKNAEQRLRDSEQHFRSLFENIVDVVTVVDTERKFIYVNDNLLKVFGYTLQEYRQARYGADFVHPDHKDEEQQLFEKVINSPGGRFPFSFQFKHKNGNWVWVEGTVQNLLQVKAVQGIVSTCRDITEQKNAELQLKQSEQRFRALFENGSDMVSIAAADGRIIFASDNVTKILGYSLEEYAKVRFEKDFIHPKDQERQKLLFTEVRQNPGKVYPFSWALKHKNDNWVWVEGTVCNLLEVDAVKGVVANFRDITQRRQDHRALQKSKANLSAIIENTTDLVYSLDKDLNFITFNELFKNTIKQVYGFDVVQGGSALGLTENLDPPVADKWRENYRKALDGTPLRFVNEYPVPDGSKVYLSYSINPIWESEKVIGLSVFSRDITKEKLDEIAMQQSEANMRSVFENTDVAINLFDTDLNLISYNSISDKHAMLFFGKDLKIGASAYDYFPEDRWPTINEVIKRVKAGETVVYEVFYPRNNDEKEWMEIKWFGVADKRNEITGIILIYRNITEKKSADIEREKITADLVRRNKDLEQFTYIISHNLRAPVANIKGLTDLLLMDAPADNESNETLGALSSSISQLDKVIIDLNNILQVGKQVNDRKEKILLKALFSEISLELRSMIQQNKVAIQCDFGGVDYVFTLMGYLYSIFQNLVVNSIKYRRNDIDPLIQIVARKVDNNIVITFTDNGKGIDLERYGSQLFGLYKRFDFSVEGKGVGLFMVKMQVETLGGSISVQSQPAQGTTFTITLPA